MKLKNLLFITMAGTFAYGCTSEEKNNTIDISDIDVKVVDNDVQERTEKIENIFFNIPSPLETTTILKNAGATYEMDLPNNPNSVEDYQTIKEQSLNMGIYGADLNYASVFNQTTETMLYLRCAKTLGEELGVEQVFDEETIDRIESNLELDDSMQVIISETFWRMNSFLKEEQRDNISALIVAGGWIEGVFLSSQLAKRSPQNDDLKRRIAEQKYSLDNLIGLINSYEAKDILTDILEDLEDLRELFKQIGSSEVVGENTVDDNGVTTIGGEITLDMSNELLEEITNRIAEIRNDII